MRPKAGHGWTAFTTRGGRSVHLIKNDTGRWVTSGAAKDWRRCPRCRVPFEADPFDSGLCVICYFYKTGLPVKEFWRLHEEGYPLAPYNIGEQFAELDNAELREGNWRKALREQKVHSLRAASSSSVKE